MKHEEVLRKLSRTIFQENNVSMNVSMNEALINLLQQNRAGKVRRTGRKQLFTRLLNFAMKLLTFIE